MKAIVKRIVDGDTIILDIYLGVTAVIPTPPVGPNIPPVDVHKSLLSLGLYIDPSGMLVMSKVSCRLYDLYAAEMGTPEGVIAKGRLSAALPIGSEVVLELHGKDKYGRWLVVPHYEDVNICLSLGGGVPMGRGVPKGSAPHK